MSLSSWVLQLWAGVFTSRCQHGDIENLKTSTNWETQARRRESFRGQCSSCKTNITACRYRRRSISTSFSYRNILGCCSCQNWGAFKHEDHPSLLLFQEGTVDKIRAERSESGVGWWPDYEIRWIRYISSCKKGSRVTSYITNKVQIVIKLLKLIVCCDLHLAITNTIYFLSPLVVFYGANTCAICPWSFLNSKQLFLLNMYNALKTHFPASFSLAPSLQYVRLWHCPLHKPR